ncbi:hypothetical protein Tco_0731308 [Tanacetum coccineum]
MSTTAPAAGVIIRDTLGVSVFKKKAPAKGDRGKGMEFLSDAALLEAAHVKEALKKSKKDSHMLHTSGSGDGVGSQPKVPDESEDKTTSTDEGTSGDSQDDESNDDDSDDDNDADKVDESKDDDGDSNADDNYRTDSDDDENPSFNLKDDEEEQKEEDLCSSLDMVSTLEHEMTQVKQSDHSTQILESLKQQIPAIVDELLNPIKGSILTLYSFDPKTLWIIENVVLSKSSSQPTSSYEAVESLTEFELKKILLDKIEKSKSYRAAPEHRQLYDALIKSYKLDKDLFESFCNYIFKRRREDKPKSSGKSIQAEEPVFETADSEMPKDQGGTDNIRMFTRSLLFPEAVEEPSTRRKQSDQRSLIFTSLNTYRSNISNMTPFTTHNNPQGIIYLDKYQQNRLMRLNELYMFCDRTLNSIRNILHDIASNLRIEYLPKRK